MVLECDILVIGGGPAGLAAARAAAAKGAKVICIEKKKKIGIPVQCAEGVASSLFRYLPFKIPTRLFPWNIAGVRFFYENGELETTKIGPAWSGFSIDREPFEQYICTLARGYGARILTDAVVSGVKSDVNGYVNFVTIISKEKKYLIKPKEIILATGSDTTFLQWLGVKLNRRAFINVYSWEFHNAHLEQPHLETIAFGKFAPKGYAYLFPKSPTIVNVGVGGQASYKTLAKNFDAFVELSCLTGQFASATRFREKSKQAVFSDIVPKWEFRNVFLVGDIANQNIKPFIEGFLPALIAGNAVGNFLTSRKPREDYFNVIENCLPFYRTSKALEEVMKGVFSEGVCKELLFFGLVTELLSVREINKNLFVSKKSLKRLIARKLIK